MQTVILNERNLNRLTETVESLRKRAELLGLEPPRLVVLRSWDEPVKGRDAAKKGLMAHLSEVEIVAPVVRLNGWQFAAKVTPIVGTADGSENLVARCQGFEADLPLSLRTTDTRCDHCQTARLRNAVYALVNEEGRWLQVGRSCLRDFLGHKDAERMAEFLAIFDQTVAPEKWRLDEDDEYERDGLRSGKFSADMEIWLTYVACTIKERGWLSSSKAREWDKTPTWLHALNAWMPDPKCDDLRRTPSDEDKSDAAAAVEWAKALGGDDPSGLSDYLWNLRALASAGTIGYRNLALAASLMQAWRRETGRIPETVARKPSEWVGTVGQRIDLTLTVRDIIELDTDWGRLNINIAKDPDENIVVWRSGGRLGDPGQTVKVKATVKSHDRYGDAQVKQTSITRAKVLEVLTETEGNGNA